MPVSGFGILSGYALTQFQNFIGNPQAVSLANQQPIDYLNLPANFSLGPNQVGPITYALGGNVIYAPNQAPPTSPKTDTAHAMAPVISNQSSISTGLIIVGAIVAAFLLFRSR